MEQIKSKFRGCLYGVLIGDSLGCPFEFRNGFDPIEASQLSKFLLRVSRDEATEEDSKVYEYTDDTEMTISLAESLLEHPEFDVKNLAFRFTEKYLADDGRRNYGCHVRSVFHELHRSQFIDVHLPATNQFKGQGSFGNGAAMRVAPVPLFQHGLSDDQLKDMVIQQSLITHSNELGYNGAILLALAIREALTLELGSGQEFDTSDFLTVLITKMGVIEGQRVQPYCNVLRSMKSILEDRTKQLTPHEVVALFGNDETALRSVPIAIYATLRAQRSIDEFDTDNKFLRTLFLSISFGGDADTIASMACSLAGTIYGVESINPVLIRRCEANEKVGLLADQMYERAIKRQLKPNI